MERRRYHVRGRVQGVGFRFWVVQHAERLGLRGWVRNRADGSVELEALGDASAHARLRELLREGPRLARIDIVEELEPTTDHIGESFEVVR